MPRKKAHHDPESRIPPHNKEAEESVLGSILIDRDAVIKIADWLHAEDFYERKYSLIYEAMMDLFAKTDPIDVLSVTNRLREKKQLEDIGGEPTVTYLATVVPTAGNVIHYARIVQKSSTRRRLISAASDISELGFEEDEDVDVVLDQAEQKLFSVSQNLKNQNFSLISDVLVEAFERIDKLHKGDHALRGVPTGYKGIDRIMAGWQRSDLIILAARPSVGKTTLALDFARHAGLHGAKVGIFSLEMSRDQLVDRMLASYARIELSRLRTGKLQESPMDGEDDFKKLSDAMNDLSQASIYIDDNASANVMGMRTMARRLQAEHGLDLLIIDYLQLMESSRYTDNRVQEVSDISRNLKKLAIELNVPIIALSQLSRAVEMRTDQRPKLSDLRESGSIEQDADVVMFLHRHQIEYENNERPLVMDVDLLIEKHRNGPTGQVPLHFHTKHVTYSEVENFYNEADFPVNQPAMAG